MGFSFGEMPEELREQVESMLVRRDMEDEDVANTMNAYLDGLTEEDIRAVTILLVEIATARSAEARANYFIGLLTGISKTKYDKCAVHGVNHDAEKVSLPVADVRAREAELIKEYRLVSNDGGTVFKCRDCDYPYVSLQDRMIKEPDDCPGCHNKSAHG